MIPIIILSIIIIGILLFLRAEKINEPLRRAKRLQEMKDLLAKIQTAHGNEDAKKREIDLLVTSIKEAECEHIIGLGGSCTKCTYISSGGYY